MTKINAMTVPFLDEHGVFGIKMGMGFITFFINLYILVIIVDAILSYMPQFKRQSWAMTIKRFADYTLKPVRKYLPRDLPFDFSPLVVIILLKLFIALF